MTASARTVADAAQLQPSIRARAEEIESARRLPADLIQDLTDAGCFRLCTPQWKTGTRPDYTAALRVVEALAEADASVGWTVGQAALAQIILGYLPRAAQEALYGTGPDLKAAGVFAPKGRATRTGDAWQVSGRWQFATGCEFASVIYLQCLVFEDRRVVLRDDGVPVTRLAVFPAGDWSILDTWDADGLRGTGSHDVVIKNAVCPAGWTCGLAETDASGKDLQSVPLMDVAGLLIAAVAVGVAAGALSDISAVAAAGARPTFSPRRLAEDPVFQDALGAAHMRYRAARALLYAQAAIIERVLAGAATAGADRASLSATCHHVTSLAAETTDACFTLARSASVPRLAPVNRRWRDIHTATQHAFNSRESTQRLGEALAKGARG
jgi:alkylation response protein AidB-like acyl-CoA dehydrogenase